MSVRKGQKFRATVTAYGPPWDSLQGMEGPGRTSTGIDLSDSPDGRLIAVDPAVIPYGTVIHLSDSPFGAANFLAADTGGAFHFGLHSIDVYDPKGRKDQNKWGRRSGIEATVVEVGDGSPQNTKAKAGIGGYVAIHGSGTVKTDNPHGVLGDVGAALGSVANTGKDIVTAPVDAAAATASALGSIGHVFELLVQRDTWFRIGKVVVGLGLLAFAVDTLSGAEIGSTATGSVSAGRTAAQGTKKAAAHVKKVVESAAVAAVPK